MRLCCLHGKLSTKEASNTLVVRRVNGHAAPSRLCGRCCSKLPNAGSEIATAVLVLTFDKRCVGEVASPGGYLRGIVQKAGAGELHLERSFYGRLSGQAA